MTPQLPAVLFFFCQKKYIENNTTYNQIHFQVIIFWLHRGEDKCSILFRDTNSDRPSPKVPHPSHILRQRYLKMDQSRPVEAGACHKVLIITTLSQKTDSTYRQNNHYQHHHWYTKISCAHEIFFFFHPSSTLYPSFTKHHQNISPNFCGMQPRQGLSLPKKVAHGYSYSGAMVTLIRRD